MPQTDQPPLSAQTRDDQAEPYLKAIGVRVRAARARRGMTRKNLSHDSGVSERYLAQLEGGQGNISVLLLRQVATAMNMTVADLVREGPEPPVEVGLLAGLLSRLTPAERDEAQALLQERFSARRERRRIALIGLRGAGKSTLGRALAQRLDVPFVQLNKVIEEDAGMRLPEIFDLFGQSAFRRLERQALDRVVEENRTAVVETGGGLVSEPETFERLLSTCHTIWLQAEPDEHMQRVVAQGDHRPMAGNREAMADLEHILAQRRALYSKADAVVDTSRRSEADCLDELTAIGRPIISG